MIEGGQRRSRPSSTASLAEGRLAAGPAQAIELDLAQLQQQRQATCPSPLT
jgi:hypothetical protein